MPNFERDGDISIHYEEQGSGFPVLALAPGGMRSSIPFWQRAPFDPLAVLSDQFRVIALDQRNAGSSRAPIKADDGWHSYAADHLALLDHLGISRCHALGGCIGGAFALKLIECAPARITAAVLQQPIGHSPENREVFYELFDSWAKEVSPQHPEATAEVLHSFRSNMYDGEFVFSVPRDVARNSQSPLLVLMGNDIYHPSATSREIVELAPEAQLIEHWKAPEQVPDTIKRVREFLLANTPG
jgi:pimeloyl-ACP methyl ester carboxylesterase